MSDTEQPQPYSEAELEDFRILVSDPTDAPVFIPDGLERLLLTIDALRAENQRLTAKLAALMSVKFEAARQDTPGILVEVRELLADPEAQAEALLQLVERAEKALEGCEWELNRHGHSAEYSEAMSEARAALAAIRAWRQGKA